ncbi:hypothetical protein MTR_8g014600 [Medicago truncatula]|uniref:Uncharacterized protein n=1 Tax=Medicago truncatula TaxID=3880 RepID=G7LGQ0_MEDTR|nr:hypothetical protein MTR_8g014600 [Medicago truncatula]
MRPTGACATRAIFQPIAARRVAFRTAFNTIESIHPLSPLSSNSTLIKHAIGEKIAVEWEIKHTIEVIVMGVYTVHP